MEKREGNVSVRAVAFSEFLNRELGRESPVEKHACGLLTCGKEALFGAEQKI